MIFISHSSKDKDLLTAFNSFLTSLGVRKDEIFCSSLEGQGVQNGERIPDKVLEAIREADFIIYIITGHFLESQYCMQELGYAWSSSDSKAFFIFKTEEVEPSEIKGFVDTSYKYSSFNTDGLSLLIDRLKELGYQIIGKFAALNDSINTFLKTISDITEILVEEKDLTAKERNEKQLKALQSQYQYLAPGAKAILADIYFSYEGARYYSVRNAVVQSLEQKLFIRRVTSVSVGFMEFGYELQPWARDYISENKTIQSELKRINGKEQIPEDPDF